MTCHASLRSSAAVTDPARPPCFSAARVWVGRWQHVASSAPWPGELAIWLQSDARLPAYAREGRLAAFRPASSDATPPARRRSRRVIGTAPSRPLSFIFPRLPHARRCLAPSESLRPNARCSPESPARVPSSSLHRHSRRDALTARGRPTRGNLVVRSERSPRTRGRPEHQGRQFK